MVNKSPEMDGGAKSWSFSRLSRNFANHGASECARAEKGCGLGFPRAEGGSKVVIEN